MKWVVALALALVAGALLVRGLLPEPESLEAGPVEGREPRAEAPAVPAARAAPAGNRTEAGPGTEGVPLGQEPRGGASNVRGRVTLPDEAPAPGEDVEFLEPPPGGLRPGPTVASSGNVVWVSRTDPDGRFQASLDPWGRFAVRVVPKDPGLAAVVLPPRVLDSAVLVRLEPACELRGRVTFRHTPLAGVPVRLSAKDEYPRQARMETSTRSDGTYALARLPPGDYVLQALPAGMPRASAVLRLGAGTTVQDFQLEAATSLSGRVLASGDRRPLPDAEVGLHGDFSQAVRVGKSGTFELFPDENAPRPRVVYARAPDSCDARLTVPEGSSDDLLILMDPGYRARGRVLDPSDAPLVGAVVTLAARSISPAERTNFKQSATDSAGRFAIRGVTPGLDHVLIVEMPGYGTFVGPVECETAGGECDLGTIRLGRAGSLFGRIVDAAGNGVEGFEVRIQRIAPQPPAGWQGLEGWLSYARPATSSGSGGFSFEGLAAGSYRVRAQWPGPGRSWSASRDVALGAGQRVDDLRFVVDDESALSGRVVGPRGDPVPNAFLTLTTAGERWKRVANLSTGRDGSFRFDGLRPGPYEILVEVEPDGIGSTAANQPAGAAFPAVAGTEGLELRLPPAAPISGFVLDAQERLIPDAIVMAVVDGYHTIASTRTGADGSFVLEGVSGTVDLLAVPTVFDPQHAIRVPDQSFGHTRFPSIPSGTANLTLRLPFAVPEDRVEESGSPSGFRR